ncbi:MAG: hypothetical protein WCA82_07735 [Jiangellales bacterium]
MSHAPTPQPRPALRKAADGSVHPASAVLSSLAVTVPSPGESGKQGGKKAKKNGKPKKAAPVEVVALEVELPKPVRKALRKRAAEYGWTAEEAAAQVLRVWADN